jgi:hypothetical protein
VLYESATVLSCSSDVWLGMQREPHQPQRIDANVARVFRLQLGHTEHGSSVSSIIESKCRTYHLSWGHTDGVFSAPYAYFSFGALERVHSFMQNRSSRYGDSTINSPVVELTQAMPFRTCNFASLS